MTVFRKSSEKDERSAVQIVNRKFPVLVQKKCHPKPEVNKLTVVLKGVSCYSSNLLMHRLQRAGSDPDVQASETGSERAKKRNGSRKEESEVVTRIENEKVECSQRQGGVQQFVLRSSRLGQAVNPLQSIRRDVGVLQTEPSALLDQKPGDRHFDKKKQTSTLGSKPVSEEPLDSLAVTRSVLEGHKICFNPKREKLIVKSGALSNCHQLQCKEGEQRTQRNETQQQLEPSTGDLAGQGASKGTERRINDCTVICKDAKRDSESCATSIGDDSLDKLAKQPKPSLLPSEVSVKNVKCRNEKRAAQLVSLCNVGRGRTSNGGFLCLEFNRSNELRDTTEQERCKPGKTKQEREHQPRFYAPSHSHETSDTRHRENVLKLPHYPKRKSSLFIAVSDEKHGGKPATRAPLLSPVLERREAIHLPKVETYEISPRSRLDNKYCSVLSEDKGRKHLRRNSSGEWSHKNKESLVSRHSLFNEQRRIAMRQPSPVSGIKLAVQDPEDVLVNTALNAVEKCNIPHETEDIPPPVKKFIIRLPPVC